MARKLPRVLLLVSCRSRIRQTLRAWMSTNDTPRCAATRSFLASPAFQKIWVAVNTRAHEQLVKILTGQGHYVQTAHGQVAIDLAPVLARIKQRLDARGVTVFDRVPTTTVKSNFVLISSKQ